MNTPKAIAIAIALAAAGWLAGCGMSTKSDAPEPSPSNIVDGRNTQVLRMPDGFRNIAVTKYIDPDGKCYMVFDTSRGAYQNGNKDFTPLPSGLAVVPCSGR